MAFDVAAHPIRTVCAALGIEVNGHGMGRCPFHPDSNPSFSINEKKNVFNCFGCEAGGGVLALVAMSHGYHGQDRWQARAAAWLSGDGDGGGKPVQPARSPVQPKKEDPPHIYPIAWRENDTVFPNRGFDNEKGEKVMRPPETHYIYRRSDGLPVMAMVNYGKDHNGNKILRPFTPVRWNHETRTPTHWSAVSPDNSDKLSLIGVKAMQRSRMPLLNSERITRDTMAVLLVEGEKCAAWAQAAFDRIGINMVAVTPAYKHPKILRQLDGQVVIIWTDNDTPGVRAGAEWAKELMGNAARVRVIGLNPTRPEGWDVADWLWEHRATFKDQVPHPAAPGRKVERFIAELYLSKVIENIQDENDLPVSEKEVVDCIGETKYLPLGVSRKKLYVFSLEKAEVLELGHGSGTLGQSLLSICSDPIYWIQRGLIDEKNGKPVDANVASMLHEECSGRRWDPASLRRRGVFMDGGSVVANTGDMLFVDGDRMSLHRQHGLKHLYVKTGGGEKAMIPYRTKALTKKEAQELQDLIAGINFETPTQTLLMTGQMVQFIVGGALRWRTHGWLTAGRGSGKTFILDSVLRRIVGKFCVPVGGNKTTEPGLRRDLSGTSFSVLFDEAEASSRNDVEAKDAILHLMRASSDSTDESKRIVQGGGGEDAASYLVRSSFLLASIGASISDDADRSRFVMYRLGKRATEAKFAEYRRKVDAMLTDDFPARFFLRCISLVPEIRAAVEMFSAAISASGEDMRRAGDTYGTLLACQHVFIRGRAPTEREVAEVLANVHVEQEIEASERSEADDVLAMIFSQRAVKESMPPYEWQTIGEIIAQNKENRQLRDKWGIGPIRGRVNTIRIFGDSVRMRQDVFGNTKYRDSWFGILQQHVARVHHAQKPTKMPPALGGKSTRRYVDISIEGILGDDDVFEDF